MPTSWRKANIFLADEYLKDVQCTSDETHFYFRCNCYHSFRKNDEPHALRVALCILLCNQRVLALQGKLYCNHSLALSTSVPKNDYSNQFPPLSQYQTPLVASSRAAFRSSPLTESLEQAAFVDLSE